MRKPCYLSLATNLLVLAFSGISVSSVAADASPVKFKLHRVGNYRSEACGVGDFNNDGKLDIVAGAR